MNTIGVAIIEDNRTVRETLALILENSPGFACTQAFASAEAALAGFPPDPPQVALVDINLPGMSGIECVRQLKARAPALQILMLTIESEAQRVFDSLAAGASGYLVKNTPPARLLEAIQDVVQGGAPMSSQIARLVVQAFQQPAAGPASEAGDPPLTPREDEILGLIARGFRTKEIADQLEISSQTVQTHVRNIYEKLHVRSRAEAVARFWNRPGASRPGAAGSGRRSGDPGSR